MAKAVAMNPNGKPYITIKPSHLSCLQSPPEFLQGTPNMTYEEIRRHLSRVQSEVTLTLIGMVNLIQGENFSLLEVYDLSSTNFRNTDNIQLLQWLTEVEMVFKHWEIDQARKGHPLKRKKRQEVPEPKKKKSHKVAVPEPKKKQSQKVAVPEQVKPKKKKKKKDPIPDQESTLAEKICAKRSAATIARYKRIVDKQTTIGDRATGAYVRPSQVWSEPETRTIKAAVENYIKTLPDDFVPIPREMHDTHSRGFYVAMIQPKKRNPVVVSVCDINLNCNFKACAYQAEIKTWFKKQGIIADISGTR